MTLDSEHAVKKALGVPSLEYVCVVKNRSAERAPALSRPPNAQMSDQPSASRAPAEYVAPALTGRSAGAPPV